MNGVARSPGEGIAGEKISYCFGKVTEAKVGLRTNLSFGLHGRAHRVKPWRVTDEDALAPPAGHGHESLTATSARAECDQHKSDGKITFGAHRGWAGVLRGDAIVTVTTPA